MAENYIEAEKDYMLGMKYKDIATKYGVTVNTVKSWKNRYKWDRKNGGKGVHTKTHTKKEKVCTQKKETYKAEQADVELSEKQRLFCLYYVKYRSQVKAYQKAYQCSYENAHRNAYTLGQNRVSDGTLWEGQTAL